MQQPTAPVDLPRFPPLPPPQTCQVLQRGAQWEAGPRGAPMSVTRRFTVTVVRLSGEGRAFEVHSRWSLRHFLEYVAAEMRVPVGFRFLMGDTVLDPDRVGEAWLAEQREFEPGLLHQDVRRVELRHWGIYDNVTLALVATQ